MKSQLTFTSNIDQKIISKRVTLGVFIFIFICLGSNINTFSTTANAEDDLSVELSSAANDTIHGTALDVEGSYQTEDIAKPRRDLERDNNDLAHKKLENMRIQEEKKITKKINNMFANNKSANANNEDADAAQTVTPVVNASEIKEAPVKILDETNVKNNQLISTLNIEEEDANK
ncbi:MAG: hypothetical protein HQK51_15870, partial [Oligoflexia bacterium]|nr:hypothetical protein [Oligoflexia bacterium]